MSRSRSQRACLLALAAALALPMRPVAAQSSLPSLGDAASETLDLGDERRLGDLIMRDIRRDPAYFDDPVLQDYVERLWQPLVVAGRRMGHVGPDVDAGFAWQAFLVRDPSVNAFALPGGYVGVHLGLIAMTARPDELASVLAHELTHVTQRHIARSIDSAQRVSAVSLAAMLLGVLAASRASNPDAAQAVIAGSQAAMIQGQLNFSRDMEREADRIGYGMLERAGFDTGAMATMFEKLGLANRLNDSGAFPYLRSHPLTAERVAEARDRAGAGRAGSTSPPPLLHELMATRARILMDSTTATLRRWQTDSTGREGEHALTAAYRQVLVTMGLRETAAASTAVDALLREAARPDLPPDARLAARRLGAETLARLGRGDAALALLDPADGSRPGLLLRVEVNRAALPAGDARRTAVLRADLESLQAMVSASPNDSGAWLQLAQTAAAVGQPLRALRAEAEARAAAGDINDAIDRLRGASRQPVGQEPIEAQIIEARLRALEAQRRQQMAADRTRGR